MSLVGEPTCKFHVNLKLTDTNIQTAKKCVTRYQNASLSIVGLTSALWVAMLKVSFFIPILSAYHDVNGKNGSPKLTCALFTKCHTESDATNFGGQKQLNGKLNCITDSDGWCKKKY